MRMFAANPELNALRTARMATAIAEGAEIIARDVGAGPGDDGPRMAAVATAAIVIELTDIPPGPERAAAIGRGHAIPRGRPGHSWPGKRQSACR